MGNAGQGPSHRPLDGDQPLLRDARTVLLGLLDCLNSEARGIRHLRTGTALTAARTISSRLDRAADVYATELGEQPLLQVVRAAIATLILTLEQETRHADPDTPVVINGAIYACWRLETALDAYRRT